MGWLKQRPMQVAGAQSFVADACKSARRGPYQAASKGEKMQYNERDWSLLVTMTSELAPEFGGRPAAFKEVCRRRPDLNATPPGAVFGGKPVNSPPGRLIRYPPRADGQRIEMRTSHGDFVRTVPMAVGEAVGNAPDANPSQRVKACEARAAASERRPDRNATPPGAAGGADPSQSAVVKACEARAAASERPDRNATPPGAAGGADPSQSAVVKACEARAAASERRPDRNATPPGAAGGADPSQSAVVKACEARACEASTIHVSPSPRTREAPTDAPADAPADAPGDDPLGRAVERLRRGAGQ